MTISRRDFPAAAAQALARPISISKLDSCNADLATPLRAVFDQLGALYPKVSNKTVTIHRVRNKVPASEVIFPSCRVEGRSPAAPPRFR